MLQSITDVLWPQSALFMTTAAMSCASSEGEIRGYVACCTQKKSKGKDPNGADGGGHGS